MKTFLMKLDQIQPSQLYISSEKLTRIMKLFDPLICESLPPIPVKKIGGRVIITDGHTRALAAFLRGLQEVYVFWDEDELDWEGYEICVQWCRSEKIFTIADLINRVVASEAYEFLWLDRCRKIHDKVDEARR